MCAVSLKLTQDKHAALGSQGEGAGLYLPVNVLADGAAYVIKTVSKFAFRAPARSAQANGAAPPERQRGKVCSQRGTTTIGHALRGAAAPVTGERGRAAVTAMNVTANQRPPGTVH